MIAPGGISSSSGPYGDDHSGRPVWPRLLIFVALSVLVHALLAQLDGYQELPRLPRNETLTVALVAPPPPAPPLPAPLRTVVPRPRAVVPVPPPAPAAGIVSEPVPAAEHPAVEDPGLAGLSSGGEGDHAREMADLVKGLQQKRAPKAGQPAMTRATPRQERNENMTPYYPTAARKQGWQGVVRLKVWVSDEGRVDKLAVVGSSGHNLLDEAAADAVRHWRFVPARRGEVAVADVVEVPVSFPSR